MEITLRGAAAHACRGFRLAGKLQSQRTALTSWLRPLSGRAQLLWMDARSGGAADAAVQSHLSQLCVDSRFSSWPVTTHQPPLTSVHPPIFNPKLPVSGKARRPLPRTVCPSSGSQKARREVDASGERSYECRDGRDDSAMPSLIEFHVPHPARRHACGPPGTSNLGSGRHCAKSKFSPQHRRWDSFGAIGESQSLWLEDRHGLPATHPNRLTNGDKTRVCPDTCQYAENLSFSI
ncbi:hypothetical protein EDB81DRAFT_278495 [Dactylonectria macrodidyma]|uniref:Uncharacterized protein n=1 Tax=Dactylonectria macrodidyma TaxID=307937 RepID=A0A9P9FPK0_9HYPO|nr:hypothetical protein EDB81DRAFT_278495 [Dactylonectria macrodidyma]